MGENFEENILMALREYASKFSSLRAAANELGIKYETFRSWHNGVKSPTIESLSRIADKIGLRITTSAPQSLPITIKAKVLDPDESGLPPQEEDYIAAPIVGEVGAGTGVIPEDNLRGWFMVHRSVVAGRALHNLVAVEIAPHSISMSPTLNPGDVVLVDKDDKSFESRGNIMLVIDPADDSTMIKRVGVLEEKGDVKITYYSDNFTLYPPQVYGLMKDFFGEWHRAIAGKVIWAWTDMRKK